MENIVLTSLTTSELKVLIQETLEKFFTETKSDSEDNDLISIAEASQLLNLSPNTIYGFTSRREIPYLKRGKKLYFSKLELYKWIQEGRRKTRTELSRDATQHLSVASKKAKTK